MGSKTRIYVFPWREKVVSQLTRLCPDVDFIKGNSREKDYESELESLKARNPDPVYYNIVKGSLAFQSVIRDIDEKKSELDGVLIFRSHYNQELASLGLPVIMVTDVLWGDQVIHYYGGKIVTSTLCEHDISGETYLTRLGELRRKINVIVALGKMRRSRILNIVPDNVKLNVEDAIMPGRLSDPRYESVYSNNLAKALGLQVVDVSVGPSQQDSTRFQNPPRCLEATYH